jgi:arsenite methyltransferase
MSESVDEVRDKMRRRFVAVALDPHAPQRHPTGPREAARLRPGRDRRSARVGDGIVRRVGNPLALGVPRRGETVLDIGCGAGVDSILAAQRVGPGGRVVGVDATDEMVAKARTNATAAGVANAEFRQGEAARLPAGDSTIDLVISNGVFNLCFDKPAVLAEVYRVLSSTDADSRSFSRRARAQ